MTSSTPRTSARRLTTALMVTALLGATAMLSACNTTAGAGADISSAGHAVTTGADKVKTAL